MEVDEHAGWVGGSAHHAVHPTGWLAPDLDGSAGRDAFHMLPDRDEPVGLAESGDRARTLGVGVGGKLSFSAADEGDHQIFGSAALG